MKFCICAEFLDKKLSEGSVAKCLGDWLVVVASRESGSIARKCG